MIEVTDEMLAVFDGTGIWADEDETRAALAAVLAIVERDHPEIERARIDDLEAGQSEMAAQRQYDEEPF